MTATRTAKCPAEHGRMPVLFIPHGAGPCFFMEWEPADTWTRMADYLKGIAATLPANPSGIILVSAHWLEPQFSVSGHASPSLIFDYHGFPSHTYELSYPAPGEPELAARIQARLRQKGLRCQNDDQRGFDHGMFIPLKLMFPEANIPVVQLSLREDLAPLAHLEAGRALAGLREEGVLIIGSGMSFHNMRGYGDARFTSISAEFDRWLTSAVESQAAERNALLEHWQEAPKAQLCHPLGGEEHLIPLLVAAGAGGDSAGQVVYSEQIMQTIISAYRFG